MSWLIPSALGIAVAAMLVALALHYIARSRPIAEPLPTARFVPPRPVHARARSTALTDLLLLVVRLAAIGAIGLAVAGPTRNTEGRVQRLFVVDRSRAVASMAEVRDSVRRLAAPSDLLVQFGGGAVRAAGTTALDTATSLNPGSLSAALASATRAAVIASARTDSVELVLVSPLVREEIDSATARLRAAWPGRIRLVPVRGTPQDTTRLVVETRANAADPVVAGLSLMGRVRGGGTIRLVRERPTPSDSAWARERGHVLLRWPASDSSAVWTPRSTIDSIGAVTSGPATLVARFSRRWMLSGRAIAHWADGEPAAVEHPTGEGCIRDVGIVVDGPGDLALRPSFRRFVGPLLEPCGGARDFRAIDSSARAFIAGVGPLAPANALRDRETQTSRWSPWLLALAAVLLTGELALRRTERRIA